MRSNGQALDGAEATKAASGSEAEFSGVGRAAALIEFQQAYQASARVLSTARELFQTLIEWFNGGFMQVSTKLFNDQQVRQFGKLTADIQQKQEKIASGKAILKTLMIRLQQHNYLRRENRNSY